MIVIIIKKASIKTKGRLLNWFTQISPTVFVSSVNKRISDNICDVLIKENTKFNLCYSDNIKFGIKNVDFV